MASAPETARPCPPASNAFAERRRAQRRPLVAGPTLAAALIRVAAPLALAVLPVVLAVAFLVAAADNQLGFDFRQFHRGAADVLAGQSPYPALTDLPRGAAAHALGPEAIQDVFRFPYPAPAAVALTPFGLLPADAAALAFVVIALLAVPATLAALGVRDWRCYGLVVAWVPVLTSVRLGALTTLLALAVVLAWRYRDRPLVVGALVGGVIAAKLFLWPLLVWLAVTRRFRAAAAGVVGAAATAVAGWAVIGFAGFGSYPSFAARLEEAVAWKSYAPSALALATGMPAPAARAAALGAGVVLLAALASRRWAPHDSRPLTIAVAASLVLSPIVWLHYFALLVVPVALADRRLSFLWAMPLVFWAIPFQETAGEVWRIAAGLSAAAVILVWAVRRSAAVARELPKAAASPSSAPA